MEGGRRAAGTARSNENKQPNNQTTNQTTKQQTHLKHRRDPSRWDPTGVLLEHREALVHGQMMGRVNRGPNGPRLEHGHDPRRRLLPEGVKARRFGPLDHQKDCLRAATGAWFLQ